MATIGDFDQNPDGYADETMSWFDKGKISKIREPGYLTVAQVSALIVAARLEQGLIEETEAAQALADFIGVTSRDIAKEKLEARNPASMLPWAEYLKMIQAGLYGNADSAPMPNMGWLVHVDEAERWYAEKGFRIDLASLKISVKSTGGGVNGLEVKPIQRSLARERAILRAIRDTGYDPLALPERAPGKRGVKAEIKALMGSRGIWAGTKVFDIAWQRLRSTGQIRGGN